MVREPIELDSDETVVCSIAQMGVLVFLCDNKHGLIRSILSNIHAKRPAAMSLLQGSPGGKIDKLLNLSRLVLHQPVR